MSTEKLKAIRHLVLDMDGTLYLGRTLFEFTPGFFDCLRRLGIGYTYITNNCSLSVDEYLEKLAGLGLEGRRDQLYTSALSTIDYLRQELPGINRLFVLGTPSLCREFTNAGYTVVSGDEEPQAIVVSFDMTLTFDRLGKAAWWIRQGKPFVATHPDPTCPTDRPTVLVDCGSLTECLSCATGRRPQAVLGKPSVSIITALLARHGLQPHELAIVGDRLNTDMAMARTAGVLGILVLTGATRPEQIEGLPSPADLVVANVGELGRLLTEAQGDRA
jgi:NagD protein